MNRAKVTVVGVVDAGAAFYSQIVDRDYADVLLVEAFDQRGAGSSVCVVAAGHAAEADVVDLVARSAATIAEKAPAAILLVSADPVDLATHLAMVHSEFPRGRVIGVAETSTERIVEMVDSIVLDRCATVPCVVLCRGEFGIEDAFAVVPCRLGARGVEEIVEERLSKEELSALRLSASPAGNLRAGIDRARDQAPESDL